MYLYILHFIKIYQILSDFCNSRCLENKNKLLSNCGNMHSNLLKMSCIKNIVNPQRVKLLIIHENKCYEYNTIKV